MRVETRSSSDSVREHAAELYVKAARRKASGSFSINVGDVHKALALRNRVPLVCMALKSRKFLQTNGLRLVSETGPASGLSTTVTYTYKFIDEDHSLGAGGDPWDRLRGALKDVFGQLGGGEAYLRGERDHFYPDKENR
jgi:hypothetical protein